MMTTAKHIIGAAVLLLMAMRPVAINAALDVADDDLVAKKDTIVGELAQDLLEDEDLKKMVIVGKDTVSVIVPEKNYGRYHRGLYTHLFVPKGQFTCGIQASYGNASSEDIQVLSYITDLDFKSTAYSFNPYISYFYKHNKSIGLRVGFTCTDFNLDSFGLDFGEDINFDLHDVKYNTSKMTIELFHRNYIGLDNSRRFAVFQETALKYGSGSGTFQRLYNDTPKVTETTSNELRLDFSPGLCVFVHERAAFNVSFGIFGWYWRHDKQVTDGANEGSRSASGANFKINLLNIKLGVAVYL